MVPFTNGTLAGLYFPSMYGIDYGIGTLLYWGKSVMSSGEGVFRSAGGCKICGGGIKGSFKCASPSIKTLDILWYLAAFLKIDAIIYILWTFTIIIWWNIYCHHNQGYSVYKLLGN